MVAFMLLCATVDLIYYTETGDVTGGSSACGRGRNRVCVEVRMTREREEELLISLKDPKKHQNRQTRSKPGARQA